MHLLVAAAFADDAAEAWARSRVPDVVPAPAEPASGLSFLGTLTLKATGTDIGTTNPLLNGQVVGELGGTNTTTVLAGPPALYTEQRAVGFLTWAPPVLGGRMRLSTGFEVDFGWGDQSYSIGGNTGGAFGADQVNLQTRRLNGRFQLWTDTSVVAGLQFVGDGAADPEASRLDELTRSGGHLLFWGSDATGVSVYGKAAGQLDYRLGGYTLYEAAFAEPDDITLWMADTRWHPAYATTLGLHGWYLRDRAAGTAGALGSGPTSVLSEMQGGPRLDLRLDPEAAAPEVSAALGWIVVDAGYNHTLDEGDLGATALVAANLGRLYVKDLPDVSVAGWLVDVEGRWRFAPGQGSVARVELLSSSADGAGGAYNGVVTGNSYGIAGATYTTHGCLLLYPDLLSINRQVALIYDSSNGGAGQIGVNASVGWDPVPDRVTVQVGGGHARTGAGEAVGTEINARLLARPYPLATVGLHGGVVLGSALEAPPWMAYLAFDQVVF